MKLDGQRLEAKLQKIAEKLDKEGKLIPDPDAGKNSLVNDRTPCGRPVMVNLREPAFKRWKVVLLDGNTIVDESLRSQYSSTRCSRYRDEGDWDEALKLV